MTSFKAFVAAGTFAAAALSPAFAQATDPCIAITTLDTQQQKHPRNQQAIINTTQIKRIVDFRSETVSFQTTVTAGNFDGGSSAALQTKSFSELTASGYKAIMKQKPATCQL